MSNNLLQWLPPEGIKLALVLFLSFLIGLEREEHKVLGAQYAFGGVRTYPLIGLIGYSLALLSGPDLMPVALGFAVVAAFLLLSYGHKLFVTHASGVTSELSGLATYVVGALVFHEQFWIATTISVASLLLLELKASLESLAQRMPPREIFTFTQFLLITAVILPILPNRDFGPYLLNPYKSWLAVVAVSAVSYGSYVGQQLSKGRGGWILTALLGGAYSSTLTTVALAKKSSLVQRPYLISGAVLMASGVMYLRLLTLVGIFNLELCASLAPYFLMLALLALGIGWAWSRQPEPESRTAVDDAAPRNPLELSAALLFGFLFLAMMVITRLVVNDLGEHGMLSLAAVMGVADVDPFVLGLTQSAGASTPIHLAAFGLAIAAASNNLVKGCYAYAWADRLTGTRCLYLLGGLAALGLVPLLWI